MIYTLLFSKRTEGVLEPYKVNGEEATLQVDADSKSSAIHHEETINYCNNHGITVRRVT